jgi:hypothetical protein
MAQSVLGEICPAGLLSTAYVEALASTCRLSEAGIKVKRAAIFGPYSFQNPLLLSLVGILYSALLHQKGA